MCNKPFYSLVIPCYNSYNTISRVMESLTKQNIKKEDIEIIVVDDNSSDKRYLDIVKGYDFNFKFVETDTQVHCPGNTRRAGMSFVTGEWLCFCDHDDFFEDNALSMVKIYIEKCKTKPMVVSTILNSYDHIKDEYNLRLAHKVAWLHGKFYNVDDLIKPFNINFKENLVTHEDIYFNALVLSILYRLGITYNYYDIPTYRWVEEPNSITRRKRTDRGYMYENFDDYIVAASDPYWGYAIATGNPIFINQLMMTLLHCYFYYEAASYYEGPTKYKDILHSTKNYLIRMKESLDITLDDIVDYVYADPQKYKMVEEDCQISTQIFIPKTSFRDFVYKLGNN